MRHHALCVHFIMSFHHLLRMFASLIRAEQLRRYDQLIQKTLASKQRVVCDMFKVPDEHFQAIADIAAQPEAPKEPTDLVLAAFAYGQTLMEIVSECMRVSESQQVSAVSTAVCDDCSVLAAASDRTKQSNHHHHIPSPTTTTTKEPLSEPTVPTIGGGLVPSATAASATISTATTATFYNSAPAPIGVVAAQDQNVSITEDEDGYCEIDEVR